MVGKGEPISMKSMKAHSCSKVSRSSVLFNILHIWKHLVECLVHGSAQSTLLWLFFPTSWMEISWMEGMLCKSVDKSTAGSKNEHVGWHSQPQVESDKMRFTGLQKCSYISLKINYQGGRSITQESHEIKKKP